MTDSERLNGMRKARSAAQALRHVVCAAVVVLMVCLVLAVPAAATSDSETRITGIADLAGAKIGVKLDSRGDAYATAFEEDEAGTTIYRYQTGADAVQALKTSKIDCVILDNISAENFVTNNADLLILDEEVDVEEYAICLKKGSELTAVINTALEKLDADGTLDQILHNYIGDDAGTMPYVKKDVARSNGVLVMATNAAFPPYEYYEGDKIVGIDVDIAQAVCDELGYELEIKDMSFDSIIPAILSGKADFGAAGMSITEERLKDVDFSNPYTSIKQVIVVRNLEPTPDTSWYDANDTEFVLYTADELAGLAVLVNGGESFEGKTVALGADIDLSGYPNWTPIGNTTYAFSGKFQGKTHSISNLYISLPENDCVGLFGNITNEINGLHLSDSFVVGYGYVGSIAGIVNGGSIVDCIVENFIVDGVGHSVGGLAGEICDESGIYACIITDGRINGNSYVGSVVGTMSRISSCSYCFISNCTVDGEYTTGGVAGDVHSSNLGNITISSSTVTGVYDSGGLGGMLWTGANWPGSSAKDCVMNNCTIIGSGITGHLWNSEVQDCTLNACMMSASGIADMVSTGVIDNCTLRDCTIAGKSFLGGIGGTVISWSEISDSVLENCTISSSASIGGITEDLVDSSVINCTLNGCSIQSLGSVSGVVNRISHSPGIYNSTHIIDCTLQNCLIKGEGVSSGVAGDVTSTNIDGCVLEDCTILGEDLVAGVVSRAINTTVHACEVIDCTITGIDNDVGGIGGYIYDGSSITSCLVENSVISGTNNVGGISGKLWEDSSASSCAVNSCTISSKDIHVGGVVGDLWNSDVYDSILINGTIIGKEYVGGIIGGAQGAISNCSVVAEITGTSYVGGITGSLFIGTVSNCISLVQYIDTDGTVPGRIDNSSSFGFVLQNNYAWSGMTSNGNHFTSDVGPNEMNGASVSSSEFWDNQSFFEDTLGWDFENTWKMNSGNDKYQLPVLKFQQTPVAGDATYLLAEELVPTPTPDNTSDFILTLSPGWNFISIPKALDASNATALALFGSLDTADNAILGYNAETQSWEQITADTVIKPLTGYWVYSTTSTAVQLTYPDVPTVPAMKQLHPGWNAVGLSADTDTSASTFFAGLNWRVALPWSCENGMYDSAIVNGGGSGNSPDRLLTLGNGCWLYVEEANVLPGLTA